ncbi:MAG: hypothetical protein GX620_13305 [Chloroflexi bacterium]|nr:hypothetical protein [Chloroflexota bacterium]
MAIDESKQRSKLGRREFLGLAGATGVLAMSTALGAGLLHNAAGEPPPVLSPYAESDTVESEAPLSASPILLLINEHSDNPFGLYLAEILRVEGLACFQVARLSAANESTLDACGIVVLAEGPLSRAQVELMERYVARGGRLVAMRPDAHLAPLFGLERAAGSLVDGYLQVAPDHPVGEGIVAEALQFHGMADHYRLAGAQAVAWLASTRDTLTAFPALTVHRYGEGHAALWAYDLARSVAYTRQGNPAWVNQERDGASFIRASDMFVDWLDLDCLAIPQADEQQRLLANLLSGTGLGREACPLPRLWYFPSDAETMLVATGDAHQNPASAVEDVLRRVEARGGHMSIYYAPPLSSGWRRAARKAKRWVEGLPLVADLVANPVAPPVPAQVADWRGRGHEFTLHPYVDEDLETGWYDHWREFTGLGYGPVSRTVRTHRVLWTGWVETARLQASYGVRLNLDYYHWGPAFCRNTDGCTYGHLTGSGLPMRFIDQRGRVLNVYQQLTQLADEHLLAVAGGPAQLTAEDAVEVSRALLNHSMAGAYSAVVAQFHVDPFASSGAFATEAIRWIEGTLDCAVAHNIPIWSAEEWLRFTEVRHNAVFESVEWRSANQCLEFHLAAEQIPGVVLSLMIPRWCEEKMLHQVEVDGQRVRHRERKVGGVEYGWFPVEAGNRYVAAIYG